ncbi:MAG TPA: hypothetical protein VFA97_09990 [Gaiellaceae bacterium]|nr:hypothetical protein [Gaiellaceae bacterium]
MQTRAADVVASAFALLTLPEQEEALAKINDARLRAMAAEENELAVYLDSLLKVAARVEELTPDSYRRARRALLAEGEDVLDVNAVIRFFGSWRRAKEAVALADVTTAAKIEARFRSRIVGKPHTYTEQTMREVLHRCAADLGGAPLVIEYEHWRQREIELAKARGEELFLPSSSPFRRKWGTWDKALEAAGFQPKEIAERLEPARERANENLRWYRYR